MANDTRRLNALEDENAKRKRLLAEQVLDNAMLWDVTTNSCDARCEEVGRGAADRGARRAPAAGVWGNGLRSVAHPLSEHPS